MSDRGTDEGDSPLELGSPLESMGLGTPMESPSLEPSMGSPIHETSMPGGDSDDGNAREATNDQAAREKTGDVNRESDDSVAWEETDDPPVGFFVERVELSDPVDADLGGPSEEKTDNFDAVEPDPLAESFVEPIETGDDSFVQPIDTRTSDDNRASDVNPGRDSHVSAAEACPEEGAPETTSASLRGSRGLGVRFDESLNLDVGAESPDEGAESLVSESSKQYDSPIDVGAAPAGEAGTVGATVDNVEVAASGFDDALEIDAAVPSAEESNAEGGGGESDVPAEENEFGLEMDASGADEFGLGTENAWGGEAKGDDENPGVTNEDDKYDPEAAEAAPSDDDEWRIEGGRDENWNAEGENWDGAEGGKWDGADGEKWDGESENLNAAGGEKWTEEATVADEKGNEEVVAADPWNDKAADNEPLAEKNDVASDLDLAVTTGDADLGAPTREAIVADNLYPGLLTEEGGNGADHSDLDLGAPSEDDLDFGEPFESERDIGARLDNSDLDLGAPVESDRYIGAPVDSDVHAPAEEDLNLETRAEESPNGSLLNKEFPGFGSPSGSVANDDDVRAEISRRLSVRSSQRPATEEAVATAANLDLPDLDAVSSAAEEVPERDVAGTESLGLDIGQDVVQAEGDTSDDLRELKKLFDDETITQDEYDELRRGLQRNRGSTNAKSLGLGSAAVRSQGMGSTNARSLGLGSAAERSQRLVSTNARSLGLGSAAERMGSTNAKSLGLRSAAERSHGMGSTNSKSLDLRSAAERLQGMGSTNARSLGLGSASEGSKGLGATNAKSLGLGSAAERSGALGSAKAKSLGLGSAAERSQGMGSARAKSLGLGSAASRSQGMGSTNARSLGLGSAAERSQGLSSTNAKSLGLGSPTERPQGLGSRNTRSLGLGPAQYPVEAEGDTSNDLRELQKLLNDGIISQDEHEELRRGVQGGKGSTTAKSLERVEEAHNAQINEDLAELDQLFADGVISQGEYDEMRRRLGAPPISKSRSSADEASPVVFNDALGIGAPVDLDAALGIGSVNAQALGFGDDQDPENSQLNKGLEELERLYDDGLIIQGENDLEVPFGSKNAKSLGLRAVVERSQGVGSVNAHSLGLGVGSVNAQSLGLGSGARSTKAKLVGLGSAVEKSQEIRSMNAKSLGSGVGSVNARSFGLGSASGSTNAKTIARNSVAEIIEAVEFLLDDASGLGAGSVSVQSLGLGVGSVTSQSLGLGVAAESSQGVSSENVQSLGPGVGSVKVRSLGLRSASGSTVAKTIARKSAAEVVDDVDFSLDDAMRLGVGSVNAESLGLGVGSVNARSLGLIVAAQRSQGVGSINAQSLALGVGSVNTRSLGLEVAAERSQGVGSVNAQSLGSGVGSVNARSFGLGSASGSTNAKTIARKSVAEVVDADDFSLDGALGLGAGSVDAQFLGLGVDSRNAQSLGLGVGSTNAQSIGLRSASGSTNAKAVGRASAAEAVAVDLEDTLGFGCDDALGLDATAGQQVGSDDGEFDFVGTAPNAVNEELGFHDALGFDATAGQAMDHNELGLDDALGLDATAAQEVHHDELGFDDALGIGVAGEEVVPNDFDFAGTAGEAPVDNEFKLTGTVSDKSTRQQDDTGDQDDAFGPNKEYQESTALVQALRESVLAANKLGDFAGQEHEIPKWGVEDFLGLDGPVGAYTGTDGGVQMSGAEAAFSVETGGYRAGDIVTGEFDDEIGGPDKFGVPDEIGAPDGSIPVHPRVSAAMSEAQQEEDVMSDGAISGGEESMGLGMGSQPRGSQPVRGSRPVGSQPVSGSRAGGSRAMASSQPVSGSRARAESQSIGISGSPPAVSRSVGSRSVGGSRPQGGSKTMRRQPVSGSQVMRIQPVGSQSVSSQHKGSRAMSEGQPIRVSQAMASQPREVAVAASQRSSASERPSAANTAGVSQALGFFDMSTEDARPGDLTASTPLDRSAHYELVLTKSALKMSSSVVQQSGSSHSSATKSATLSSEVETAAIPVKVVIPGGEEFEGQVKLDGIDPGQLSIDLRGAEVEPEDSDNPNTPVEDRNAEFEDPVTSGRKSLLPLSRLSWGNVDFGVDQKPLKSFLHYVPGSIRLTREEEMAQGRERMERREIPKEHDNEGKVNFKAFLREYGINIENHTLVDMQESGSPLFASVCQQVQREHSSLWRKEDHEGLHLISRWMRPELRREDDLIEYHGKDWRINRSVISIGPQGNVKLTVDKMGDIHAPKDGPGKGNRLLASVENALRGISGGKMSIHETVVLKNGTHIKWMPTPDPDRNGQVTKWPVDPLDDSYPWPRSGQCFWHCQQPETERYCLARVCFVKRFVQPNGVVGSKFVLRHLKDPPYTVIQTNQLLKKIYPRKPRSLTIESANDPFPMHHKRGLLQGIAATLFERYGNGLIYSFIDSSCRQLLYLNPYRERDIYKAEYVKKYLRAVQLKNKNKLPHHLFETCARALMVHVDSTLLFHGDDGSGKFDQLDSAVSFYAELVGVPKPNADRKFEVGDSSGSSINESENDTKPLMLSNAEPTEGGAQKAMKLAHAALRPFISVNLLKPEAEEGPRNIFKSADTRYTEWESIRGAVRWDLHVDTVDVNEVETHTFDEFGKSVNLGWKDGKIAAKNGNATETTRTAKESRVVNAKLKLDALELSRLWPDSAEVTNFACFYEFLDSYQFLGLNYQEVLNSILPGWDESYVVRSNIGTPIASASARNSTATKTKKVDETREALEFFGFDMKEIQSILEVILRLQLLEMWKENSGSYEDPFFERESVTSIHTIADDLGLKGGEFESVLLGRKESDLATQEKLEKAKQNSEEALETAHAESPDLVKDVVPQLVDPTSSIKNVPYGKAAASFHVNVFAQEAKATSKRFSHKSTAPRMSMTRMKEKEFVPGGVENPGCKGQETATADTIMHRVETLCRNLYDALVRTIVSAINEKLRVEFGNRKFPAANAIRLGNAKQIALICKHNTGDVRVSSGPEDLENFQRHYIESLWNEWYGRLCNVETLIQHRDNIYKAHEHIAGILVSMPPDRWSARLKNEKVGVTVQRANHFDADDAERIDEGQIYHRAPADQLLDVNIGIIDKCTDNLEGLQICRRASYGTRANWNPRIEHKKQISAGRVDEKMKHLERNVKNQAHRKGLSAVMREITNVQVARAERLMRCHHYIQNVEGEISQPDTTEVFDSANGGVMPYRAVGMDWKSTFGIHDYWMKNVIRFIRENATHDLLTTMCDLHLAESTSPVAEIQTCIEETAILFTERRRFTFMVSCIDPSGMGQGTAWDFKNVRHQLYTNCADLALVKSRNPLICEMMPLSKLACDYEEVLGKGLKAMRKVERGSDNVMSILSEVSLFSKEDAKNVELSKPERSDSQDSDLSSAPPGSSLSMSYQRNSLAAWMAKSEMVTPEAKKAYEHFNEPLMNTAKSYDHNIRTADFIKKFGKITLFKHGSKNLAAKRSALMGSAPFNHLTESLSAGDEHSGNRGFTLKQIKAKSRRRKVRDLVELMYATDDVIVDLPMDMVYFTLNYFGLVDVNRGRFRMSQPMQAYDSKKIEAGLGDSNADKGVRATLRLEEIFLKRELLDREEDVEEDDLDEDIPGVSYKKGYKKRLTSVMCLRDKEAFTVEAGRNAGRGAAGGRRSSETGAGQGAVDGTLSGPYHGTPVDDSGAYHVTSKDMKNRTIVPLKPRVGHVNPCLHKHATKRGVSQVISSFVGEYARDTPGIARRRTHDAIHAHEILGSSSDEDNGFNELLGDGRKEQNPHEIGGPGPKLGAPGLRKPGDSGLGRSSGKKEKGGLTSSAEESLTSSLKKGGAAKPTLDPRTSSGSVSDGQNKSEGKDKAGEEDQSGGDDGGGKAAHTMKPESVSKRKAKRAEMSKRRQNNDFLESASLSSNLRGAHFDEVGEDELVEHDAESHRKMRKTAMPKGKVKVAAAHFDEVDENKLVEHDAESHRKMRKAAMPKGKVEVAAAHFDDVDENELVEHDAESHRKMRKTAMPKGKVAAAHFAEEDEDELVEHDAESHRKMRKTAMPQGKVAAAHFDEKDENELAEHDAEAHRKMRKTAMPRGRVAAAHFDEEDEEKPKEHNAESHRQMRKTAMPKGKVKVAAAHFDEEDENELKDHNAETHRKMRKTAMPKGKVEVAAAHFNEGDEDELEQPEAESQRKMRKTAMPKGKVPAVYFDEEDKEKLRGHNAESHRKMRKTAMPKGKVKVAAAHFDEEDEDELKDHNAESQRKMRKTAMPKGKVKVGGAHFNEGDEDELEQHEAESHRKIRKTTMPKRKVAAAHFDEEDEGELKGHNAESHRKMRKTAMPKGRVAPDGTSSQESQESMGASLRNSAARQLPDGTSSLQSRDFQGFTRQSQGSMRQSQGSTQQLANSAAEQAVGESEDPRILAASADPRSSFGVPDPQFVMSEELGPASSRQVAEGITDSQGIARQSTRRRLSQLSSANRLSEQSQIEGSVRQSNVLRGSVAEQSLTTRRFSGVSISSQELPGSQPILGSQRMQRSQGPDASRGIFSQTMQNNQNENSADGVVSVDLHDISQHMEESQGFVGGVSSLDMHDISRHMQDSQAIVEGVASLDVHDISQHMNVVGGVMSQDVHDISQSIAQNAENIAEHMQDVDHVHDIDDIEFDVDDHHGDEPKEDSPVLYYRETGDESSHAESRTESGTSTSAGHHVRHGFTGKEPNDPTRREATRDEVLVREKGPAGAMGDKRRTAGSASLLTTADGPPETTSKTMSNFTIPPNIKDITSNEAMSNERVRSRIDTGLKVSFGRDPPLQRANGVIERTRRDLDIEIRRRNLKEAREKAKERERQTMSKTQMDLLKQRPSLVPGTVPEKKTGSSEKNTISAVDYLRMLKSGMSRDDFLASLGKNPLPDCLQNLDPATILSAPHQKKPMTHSRAPRTSPGKTSSGELHTDRRERDRFLAAMARNTDDDGISGIGSEGRNTADATIRGRRSSKRNNERFSSQSRAKKRFVTTRKLRQKGVVNAVDHSQNAAVAYTMSVDAAKSLPKASSPKTRLRIQSRERERLLLKYAARSDSKTESEVPSLMASRVESQFMCGGAIPRASPSNRVLRKNLARESRTSREFLESLPGRENSPQGNPHDSNPYDSFDVLSFSKGGDKRGYDVEEMVEIGAKMFDEINRIKKQLEGFDWMEDHHSRREEQQNDKPGSESVNSNSRTGEALNSECGFHDITFASKKLRPPLNNDPLKNKPSQETNLFLKGSKGSLQSETSSARMRKNRTISKSSNGSVSDAVQDSVNDSNFRVGACSSTAPLFRNQLPASMSPTPKPLNDDDMNPMGDSVQRTQSKASRINQMLDQLRNKSNAPCGVTNGGSSSSSSSTSAGNTTAKNNGVNSSAIGNSADCRSTHARNHGKANLNADGSSRPMLFFDSPLGSEEEMNYEDVTKLSDQNFGAMSEESFGAVRESAAEAKPGGISRKPRDENNLLVGSEAQNPFTDLVKQMLVEHDAKSKQEIMEKLASMQEDLQQLQTVNQTVNLLAEQQQAKVGNLDTNEQMRGGTSDGGSPFVGATSQGGGQAGSSLEATEYAKFYNHVYGKQPDLDFKQATGKDFAGFESLTPEGKKVIKEQIARLVGQTGGANSAVSSNAGNAGGVGGAPEPLNVATGGDTHDRYPSPFREALKRENDPSRMASTALRARAALQIGKSENHLQLIANKKADVFDAIAAGDESTVKKSLELFWPLFDAPYVEFCQQWLQSRGDEWIADLKVSPIQNITADSMDTINKIVNDAAVEEYVKHELEHARGIHEKFAHLQQQSNQKAAELSAEILQSKQAREDATAIAAPDASKTTELQKVYVSPDFDFLPLKERRDILQKQGVIDTKLLEHPRTNMLRQGLTLRVKTSEGTEADFPFSDAFACNPQNPFNRNAHSEKNTKPYDGSFAGQDMLTQEDGMSQSAVNAIALHQCLSAMALEMRTVQEEVARVQGANAGPNLRQGVRSAQEKILQDLTDERNYWRKECVGLWDQIRGLQVEMQAWCKEARYWRSQRREHPRELHVLPSHLDKMKKIDHSQPVALRQSMALLEDLRTEISNRGGNLEARNSF